MCADDLDVCGAIDGGVLELGAFYLCEGAKAMLKGWTGVWGLVYVCRD